MKKVKSGMDERTPRVRSIYITKPGERGKSKHVIEEELENIRQGIGQMTNVNHTVP